MATVEYKLPAETGPMGIAAAWARLVEASKQLNEATEALNAGIKALETSIAMPFDIWSLDKFTSGKKLLQIGYKGGGSGFWVRNSETREEKPLRDCARDVRCDAVGPVSELVGMIMKITGMKR